MISSSPRIGVVGAGAVGLATAVQFQRALPSAKVTVIAERFTDLTTSWGAAGLLRPTPAKTPGVPPQVFNECIDESWRFFSTLANSEQAGEAGCQVTSGYEFYNTEQDNQYLSRTLYSHTRASPKEMSMYPGPRYSVGYRGTSILTSPKRFLPYLMKQFRDAGGQVEQQKLNSLECLVGKYDVVMNCCGLGAREFLNDKKIYGLRGHVLMLEAPWIKNYLYTENGKGGFSHVYPTPDYVVVGGIRQKDDYDLTPRKSDRDQILNNACEHIPSLRRARILGEWVGLRPMRNPLRLEMENLQFQNGKLFVVHNYGHGGEGISLSWGTASYAVRLAIKQLTDQTSAKL